MSDLANSFRISVGIFSAVMFLLGLFVFAAVIRMGDEVSSGVSMLLMVVGTAFFLLGIYKLLTTFLLQNKTN